MSESEDKKVWYFCDGEGCERNCAEVGYDQCHHTWDVSHALNFGPIGDAGFSERERTCHMIPEPYPHNCETPAWKCSVCGYEFDEYMQQTARYCPNCGAKVVGDE